MRKNQTNPNLDEKSEVRGQKTEARGQKSGFFSLTSVLCILSSFSLVFLSFHVPESDWTLKKDVDGIKVYYRETSASDIKELKIVFTVEGSLSSIIAVMNDVQAFPEWIYRCENPKVLKKDSDTSMYYYHTVNFPWPLRDRDVVSRSTIQQDPYTKIISTHNVAAPAMKPEVPGMIRVKTLDIKWVIMPVGKDLAQIDYFLLTDPGGHIPSWLINLALDRGPVKSMQGFREMVKKPKYRDAEVSFIRD